jgi:phage terminase large subunit-like protein
MDKITKYLRNLKQSDPKKFAELIMQMDEKELALLQKDFFLWARDNQIAPEGDWRYLLVLAGRGLV